MRINNGVVTKIIIIELHNIPKPKICKIPPLVIGFLTYLYGPSVIILFGGLSGTGVPRAFPKCMKQNRTVINPGTRKIKPAIRLYGNSITTFIGITESMYNERINIIARTERKDIPAKGVIIFLKTLLPVATLYMNSENLFNRIILYYSFPSSLNIFRL